MRFPTSPDSRSYDQLYGDGRRPWQSTDEAFSNERVIIFPISPIERFTSQEELQDSRNQGSSAMCKLGSGIPIAGAGEALKGRSRLFDKPCQFYTAYLRFTINCSDQDIGYNLQVLFKFRHSSS